MKNPHIFNFFFITLLISSCCKPNEIEPNVPNPLIQFIGKWVPVEYIVDGQPILGPFSGTGFFGAYDDSFEVIDTSGYYIPAVYFNNEFSSSYPRKGLVLYEPQSKIVTFREENLIWTSGAVERVNENEMWILSNKGSLLKLKKI